MAPPDSLGELLRTNRQSLGLTLEQAARRLRTKTAVLQALENNNFKALGAPVFVRMYLVRYAEQLGLAEHEVLGRYKQLGIDRPPPLRPAHSVQPQARASDLRWLTYPAAFALLAWLGWTVTQQQDVWRVDEQLARTTSPSVPVLSAPAPDSPADPLAAVTAAPPAETLSQIAPPDETISLAADETISLATVEQPAAVEDTVSIPAESPAMASTAGTLNNGALQPIGTAMASASETESQLPDGQIQLVMEFIDECWVEVEDGRGRRLVYGLLNANESRSLTGPGPFSIKLGNARAVQRISLNGEAIDPSLYVPERGSISRFTLNHPPRG